MLLPRSQHPTTRRQDRSSLGSEASSLGSNLVFDQVLRMVGVGPAWACATRPGSDRFFREEWIIDIKQESKLWVRKSGGQIQLKTAHPRVYF
jgi:hypothetical protein